MKIKNKSLVLFFSIVLILLIQVVSISPNVSAANTTYISASDILKNFEFESIGDETIVNDGAFNNKLRFDTQASWLLYQDDMTLITQEEIGGSTRLKYRMVLRNKINIYTNVRIKQMAQQMLVVPGKYLGVTYSHYRLGGLGPDTWNSYITWDHWDFGDIYNYNWANNYFSGRIVMSFDIDDNPIPDTFGTGTETEYDYIAVSEAGIVNNIWGSMSDDMPEVVVLNPSEYESEEKDTATHQAGSTAADDIFAARIEPNVRITVPTNPTQSFDSSILPDTAGSSMNPKNKDGSAIWDPQIEERSMTGCNIYYDLGALSPVVYKYEGSLTYKQHNLQTETYLTPDIWDFWATYVDKKHHYTWDRVVPGDVALHGINRYIQVDMYVAFEVWTSVKLGTLTDYYENMKLSAPSEYYDALIWSTIAGGWAGSTIEEWGMPGLDLFGETTIIILIIVAIIVVIGLFVGYRIFKRTPQGRMISKVIRK